MEGQEGISGSLEHGEGAPSGERSARWSRRSVFVAAILLLTACATAWAAQRWRESHRIERFDRSQRRELLARRDAAQAVGDAATVAVIHAELSRDALVRAEAVHDAWMTRRDRRTGLFPQSLTARRWNYHNVGADFFGFQFAIAHRLRRSSVPLLRETLARERALNPGPGLCRPIDWRHGTVFDDTPRHAMFSTSEYLKDGLVGLYERTGEPAVFERMKELADAVIDASATPTKFGPIPSRDSEVNGNILQVFARLSFAAGEPRCAEMAARITDAVVGQMLPRSRGLPVLDFDYAADAMRSREVHLRDHGNETAVGLSEAFALAVSKRDKTPWTERAERWAEPLAAMYEQILSRGVRPDGLIVNALDLATLAPSDAGACDNWGYLLCGAVLFTQAAERHGVISRDRLDAILAAVDRVALAVTRTDGLAWEGTHHDGFADSIESAIYIAKHRPELRERLLRWADGQIGYMYECQHPDGFVSGDYLDGNFIRTAMRYADARGGGTDAEVVPAPAGLSRTGRLHLPWDWPRVNSWPEW